MSPTTGFRLTATVLTLLLVSVGAVAQRRDVFIASRDHAAIRYSTAEAMDPAAALNRRLKAGQATLKFEPGSGYLKSLLAALGVPVESQALVFSKTSFQASHINYRNPRAVYFNDTVAIGWVRGGDILEIAAHDPTQGVVFYSLDQEQKAAPTLKPP